MPSNRPVTQPFHLIRYFSLTTLATMVVGAVVVAAIVTRLTRQELVVRSESHAVAVAHHLIYELYHRFLLPQMEAGENTDIDTMASWEEINRLAAPLQHFQDLHDVKIFGPNGTIIYSSFRNETGRQYPASPGFRAAMQGRVYSEAPGDEQRAALPGEWLFAKPFKFFSQRSNFSHHDYRRRGKLCLCYFLHYIG